jgi:hypothetical protein
MLTNGVLANKLGNANAPCVSAMHDLDQVAAMP